MASVINTPSRRWPRIAGRAQQATPEETPSRLRVSSAAVMRNRAAECGRVLAEDPSPPATASPKPHRDEHVAARRWQLPAKAKAIKRIPARMRRRAGERTACLPSPAPPGGAPDRLRNAGVAVAGAGAERVHSRSRTRSRSWTRSCGVKSGTFTKLAKMKISAVRCDPRAPSGRQAHGEQRPT